MKRSGTLTTPVTGLLIIVLLMGMEITKAQSFFRQTGIQLLTKQEGLSNNTLTEIHQDKDGFLWLGTDVGLSRYDGIHFQTTIRQTKNHIPLPAFMRLPTKCFGHG